MFKNPHCTNTVYIELVIWDITFFKMSTTKILEVNKTISIVTNKGDNQVLYSNIKH